MSNNPFNDAQTFMGVESVTADDLFGDTPQEPEVKVELPGEETPEKKKEENNIPEGPVDAQDLFGSEDPESVGEDNEEKEETKPTKTGSSPKDGNPYSSFAQALRGDGLFQFLDENTVNNINDADSFSEAFEQEVNARLDDATRKVKEALEAGVQPNMIASYQNTIKRLNDITDEQLSDESELGANLRRSILKQDLLIRGYKPEKVDKQVDRIMASGTDVEDATDALESVKEYFVNKYNDVVAEAKESAAEEKRKTKQEIEDFRKAVLEKDKLFDDIPIDRATRKKAFEAMTRIVETTEDGEQLTVVQKYADENPVEFRTVLGIVYALTDGFTKMGNLLTKSVNKKVNSNLKEIERRINNQGYQGGSLNLIEGNDGGKRQRDFSGIRIDIP